MDSIGTEPKKQDNNIALKRYAARIAMEGEAEKARREAEEKMARDRELAEEKEKQRESDKKAAEERVMRDKAAAEEREKKETANAALGIKNEIDKIKSEAGQRGSLRTLKRDMDEMVREQNISIARIAMQEEARKRTSGITEARQEKVNWFKYFLIIVFLLSGAGVGAYFYMLKMAEQTTLPQDTTTPPVKNIISIEKSVELPLGGLSYEKITAEIKDRIGNIDVPNGSVYKITLTKKDVVNVTTEITPVDLLNAIKSGAPGDLTRSLGDNMLLGVVNTIIGARGGIIIMGVDSYQNAFAGMLKWEKGSMVRDIYEIINSKMAEEYLSAKNFEDLVLNNQDTRVLKDETGKIVMIYGFMNSKTLAIAGDSDVFNEILNRFRNSPNQ